MPPKITLSRKKATTAQSPHEEPPEIVDISQENDSDTADSDDFDFDINTSPKLKLTKKVSSRVPRPSNLTSAVSKKATTLGKRTKSGSDVLKSSPSSSSFPNRLKKSVSGSLIGIDIGTGIGSLPINKGSSTSSASSGSGGSGAVGKMSNIKKLEALARATTKIKQDYNSASAQPNGKECLPWVERNFPTNLDELFVHKKKVSDVKVWMEQAFNPPNPAYASKMCLLTGPSGSGKTATACLLAKELDGEIKEWINPMTLTHFKEGSYNADEIQGRSQLDLFSDFLLRSSQYASLPMRGRKHCKHRIVIVEDFPNVFYRDTQVFHNILRNYSSNGVSPVIFIVPDNASGEFNPLKLFPKQLIQELRITQFTFNAVAPSLMTKCLMMVCNREKVSVEQSVLDGVTAASGGDMRCAINTLQFKVLQEKPSTKEAGGGFKRPFPRTAKLKKDKMFKGQDLTQKDESLFLFRALGKVLYNKRERLESPLELELTEKLVEERRRHPTQEIPEEITNKIEVSTDTFLGFLHQNYGNFFSTIETCAKAASYLSDAEVLLSRWTFDDHSYGSKSFKSKDTREKIGLSIAVRGLMHANTVKISSQWRPLRKPLCGDIYFKTLQNFERAKSLFPALISNVQDFYYDNLPMYAKNGGARLNPEQKAFAREIGLYKDSKQLNKARWTETLDENFAVLEDNENDTDKEDDLLGDVAKSKIESGKTTVGGAAPHLLEVKSLDTKMDCSEGTAEDYRIDEFDDDYD